MTAIVQSKFAEVVSLASISLTLDSTPVAGNLLVAVETTTAAFTTPIYPWGGTPDYSVLTQRWVYFVSKVAGSSESKTITSSWSGNRNVTLAVIEISPTAGRQWNGLDQSATATNGFNASCTLTTGAQTEVDNVAIAGMSINNGAASLAWSNGFSMVGAPSSTARGFAGYAVLGSGAAATTTATLGASQPNAGGLVTYKQTTAGGGPPPTGNQNIGFFAIL